MALEYLTWWLSPGVACFLFLNVLVAAIAVTSRSRSRAQQGGRATSTRRLCRSASSMVLDRLRSFSTMFSTHPSVEFCYYYVSPPPEAEEREVSEPAPDRQLAVPEPATMAATAISMSENAEDETAAGVVKSMSSDVGDGTQESMPSSPPPAAPAVAVLTAETARVAALVRRPPKEKPVTVAELVKRKHRAHAYALEGKAELNARAEQFIRQFRQELKLQRLDSMLSQSAATPARSAPDRARQQADRSDPVAQYDTAPLYV